MNADILIEGLRIMQKYGSVDVEPGYDIIYAGPDINDVADKMSKNDIARLEELGWFMDEDSWAILT